MIWTAIFKDKTTKVFSTHYTNVEDAQSYVKTNFPQPLFALIKGNHSEVKFFDE